MSGCDPRHAHQEAVMHQESVMAALPRLVLLSLCSLSLSAAS
jgi:hypothetical protein